ncbi:hypothetical protein [Haladaptatus pallidirubidus]|uniref:Uncharacterized protein n=2 Tax=Haladaptatus pallidirubidus TaxID=1008152 RepID=A0AAV3UD71_9EURY
MFSAAADPNEIATAAGRAPSNRFAHSLAQEETRSSLFPFASLTKARETPNNLSVELFGDVGARWDGPSDAGIVRR